MGAPPPGTPHTGGARPSGGPACGGHRRSPARATRTRRARRRAHDPTACATRAEPRGAPLGHQLLDGVRVDGPATIDVPRGVDDHASIVARPRRDRGDVTTPTASGQTLNT